MGETETIQLNEDIVNLGVKLGPQDFELKKVLGKGGYGKVFQVKTRKPFFSFFEILKIPFAGQESDGTRCRQFLCDESAKKGVDCSQPERYRTHARRAKHIGGGQSKTRVIFPDFPLLIDSISAASFYSRAGVCFSDWRKALPHPRIPQWWRAFHAFGARGHFPRGHNMVISQV